MIGLDEGNVFYNHRKGYTTDYSEPFSPVEELPKPAECELYFRQFLHNYDSARLARQLMKNIQFGRYVLDISCEDILNCKPFIVEECLQTPFCTNKQHVPPSHYLHQLYKALVLRPLYYLPICENVCYKEALQSVYAIREKTVSFEEGQSSLSHIQINLLNTSVKPLFIRNLLSDMQEKFVVVPGIIVQTGKPVHKISKMTLQCRFCDHKMAIDVPVWRERPPIPRRCNYSSLLSQNRGGGGIMSPVDKELGCRKQLDPYVIVTSECTYVDVQSLKMQELPEDVPTGDMPRQLRLNASRYLCEKMAPGDRVYVHGVLTSFDGNAKFKHSDGINSSYLHVLGFQRYEERKGEETEFTLHERTLFENLAQSPDVHSKIFSSISPSIYGNENIKKAAASLLFGGTRKQSSDGSKLRGDINVLLLGDPSVAKSQILKFVDKVAPISVYTSGKGSSAAGLTAAVVRDRQGVYSLEGGAMVLADGGVVCVDEFDKMGQDDIVAIHEAMEQQTISISKAGITTMLNSRCAVLAAANPSFGSFDDSQDSSEQHEFKATILSRFDLIFLLRDKELYDRDLKLCSHIMSLHANAATESEAEIPFNILTKYIQYAKSKCFPILSKDAVDSLKNFYVQTRADSRSDNRSVTRKIPITARQLDSLVRLSESFAKMELRDVATEKHALMAIELFTVATAETAKHSILYETLTPVEKKAVKQSEEALLGRLPMGQRVSRVNLLRDLEMKGLDRRLVGKALNALIKRGILQERGDLSVRRV